MKKKRILSILAASLVFSVVSVQTAFGYNRLGDPKMYLNEENGVELFYSGDSVTDLNTDTENVADYFKQNNEKFKITDENSGYEVNKTYKDDLGFTHVFMNQTYDGTEVYGRTLTAHFDENGNLSSVTGSLENRIASIEKENLAPLSANEAIEIAEASKAYDELSEEAKAVNYIYYKDGKAYDVYKVNVVYDLPDFGSYDIFVDRYSGNIVGEKNLIRNGNATGTGTAVNGDTRTLNLYKSGSRYYMQDRTKDMDGYISTYTANQRQTTSGSLVYRSSSTMTDKAAVSAHAYAEVVYDFYHNMFNRDSLDDNGMSINSVVHYGYRYNNAFWNGYKMVYGDGDGRNFTTFSGDLDVVAHEMTHGVTTNTCDLNYENQPGAMNESMSDVLGVLIQTYDKYNVENGGTWQFNANDWQVGDEIYTPGVSGDALRSLANPTLYDQPDNMDDYQNLPNTENGDYGGVHINSGIPNKAAFLVAQSIGCEKTARIYYRALSVYFNSTTNFAQAKAGLRQAAADLYGSNSTAVQAINNAYASVGIN